MNPGDTVRWWTQEGGWRFGRLVSTVGARARVERGGTIRRVPISELKPWPPEPATVDTTPPRRGKRGK